MNFILRHLFLFFLGGIGGWIIEFFFRRIVHKKWVNPGFLTGPCLPLYGSGLCLLYFMCNLNIQTSLPTWLESTLVILLTTALVILLEYLTGLYFLKVNHVRLWDYTDRPGNIQGLICPLFSIFWLLIVIFYYIVLNPLFVQLVGIVMQERTWLIVCLSILSSIFIVDFSFSVHLVTRLKKFASEKKLTILFENLKESIDSRHQKRKEKKSFLLPFHVRHGSLKQIMEECVEAYRKKKQDVPLKDGQMEPEKKSHLPFGSYPSSFDDLLDAYWIEGFHKKERKWLKKKEKTTEEK